ncbi:hypothetical protein [Mycolicibacterium litorale]|nr:hypothetical protein [Mycolicibacterium litorale]MCV7415259.1 hypothetical protein [Mycolicibacterium litorale]
MLTTVAAPLPAPDVAAVQIVVVLGEHAEYAGPALGEYTQQRRRSSG